MIVFSNPGAMDTRCITTFGVNVKAKDNAIGTFGTGLKYAIAVVLRLGGRFDIFTEGKWLAFEAAEEEIRGKVFQTVHYTTPGEVPVPCGFTTELAKNWFPWMAYRELRSNMMDEGGEILEEIPAVSERDSTLVVVACPEVEKAHENSPLYFIETAPIWSSDSLEIHPAGLPGIFYRGIRVGERKSSLYTYNILSAQTLTEDRTLDSWMAAYAITRGLAKLDNQSLAEEILLADGGLWESTFSFAYEDNFSPEMLAAIKLRQFNKNMNSSARRRAKELYRDDFLPKALPMTDEHRERIAETKALMTSFGLSLGWDIRLAWISEDGDQIQVLNKTLWVTQDVLMGPGWLPELLRMVHFNKNVDWPSLILRVMSEATPDNRLLMEVQGRLGSISDAY